MAKASPLGRRSSVAVLTVTAAAVAMLAILVGETSRGAGDAALVGAAGRQRLLSERVTLTAVTARIATGTERGLWLQRYQDAAASWRRGADFLPGVHPSDSAVLASATAFRQAAPLKAAMLTAAERTVAPGAGPATADSLLRADQRYIGVMDQGLAALELESELYIDRLVQIEAACVILLLGVLVLVVRLALRPAEEQLTRTVSALAENESRTRAMLDAMSEGMVLSDDTGHLLAWNPSAERVLGLTTGWPADLAGIAAWLVDERGEPLTVEQMPSRITIRTGKPLSNVIIGVREQGEGGSGRLARWLSVNSHPLFRGETTTPHAAVAIFRDVSDARQLEEERAAQAEALELQNQELLAQSEALAHGQALFRSLVDTVGNTIVGLDTSGNVFEWNREAELLFGVARRSAIGCSFVDEFVPEPHGEQMRVEIAAVLGGEARRNHTGPVLATSGEWRTVIWNVTALRAGADGPIHGLIAAGLDITEREASDERFRVLFERSSDAHLLIDDHGIIDCNDATLRLLQVDSKTSLVGRSASDLSPRRQADGRLSIVVSAQMRQLARDRGYHRFEWMHLRADGRQFPVEVTLTPVRLNGREAILSVWHDIAERKAVESALRAAKDAAESANRTKSDFMTRMNHELRTPLTAIIGFSKVLLQGKQGALSDGAQRYAERIRANGLHLLSLINQILDVAKVEAGRMDLEPERITVGGLVSETIHMLEATADMKEIGLRAEVPDNLGTIVTDAAKLRQILINLVGNAIKFTDTGEVVVKVEADPLSARPVSITIRDTGIGIPLDRQQKVFEPFEQGDSSTRRQFGGTGLGLSIVKAFAELIGAAIEVESEVGQGTAFTVWLAPTDLELPLPSEGRR